MDIENQLQYLYYNWVQLRSTRITMVIHPIQGPYNIVYPLATGTASYWDFLSRLGRQMEGVPFLWAPTEIIQHWQFVEIWDT